MEQNEIIECNFLISKYNGWAYKNVDEFIKDRSSSELHNYHQDWNKLIETILKINSNGFFFFWQDYVVRICRFCDGSGDISRNSFLKKEDAKMAIYATVCEFLKYWHKELCPQSNS